MTQDCGRQCRTHLSGETKCSHVNKGGVDAGGVALTVPSALSGLTGGLNSCVDAASLLSAAPE
jgi:hypothetical protein